MLARTLPQKSHSITSIYWEIKLYMVKGGVSKDLQTCFETISGLQVNANYFNFLQLI